MSRAGDPAGAMAWATAASLLRGSLRVALIGADPSLVQRTARRLEEEHPDVVWLAIAIDAGGVDADVDPRWLGAHVAAWVTAPPSPLGADERAVMARIGGVGCPSVRACWLVDTDLVARISDDPAREIAEMQDRVRGAAPRSWPLVEDPREWLAARHASFHELRAERLREVAAFLVNAAAHHADQTATAEEAAAASIDRVLAERDAALAAAVDRARRDAAHVLASVKRHLEETRFGWTGLIQRIDADLPAQMAPVDDEALDRALGPWLHAATTAWLRDRLARMRGEVVADLAHVAVDPDAAACVAIVLPAISAPGLRREPDWMRRIGVTASVGAGAALLLTPLWPMGIAAIGGGLLWSQIGRGTIDRDARLAAARTALARLGQEVDQRLAEQVAAVEGALTELRERRAAAATAADADARARLVERRAFHRSRAEAARAIVVDLQLTNGFSV